MSRLPPRFDVALADVRAERPEFRVEAAQVLGLAEGEENRARAARALRPLLADEHHAVKLAAIDALASVGEDADTPRFVSLLADARRDVREAAALALGRLGGPMARDALVDASTSEHPEVRFQAVVGLGTLVDERGRAIAVAALEDADPRVREVAVEALEELGAAPHRDALARALEDAAPEVRRSAAIALGGLEDPRAAQALAEVLRTSPNLEALKAACKLASPALEPALAAIAGRRFGPRDLRFLAAAGLSRMGLALGDAVLRSGLAGFFVATRLHALAAIGYAQLTSLAPDVAALVDRPRGLPLDSLAHTLERLDESPAAQAALARIDALLGGSEHAETLRHPLPPR